MNDEIKRILKLLEDGKINSVQASELIEALGTDKNKQDDIKHDEQKGETGKNLKVNIKTRKGENINLKFPLKFIKGIIKATGKIPLHINGSEEFDMKVLSEAIENNTTGKILELNSNSGDFVEIIIQ